MERNQITRNIKFSQIKNYTENQLPILDVINIGIIIIQNYKIIFLNKKMVQLLEFKKTEILGCKFDKFVVENDKNKAQKMYRSIINNREFTNNSEFKVISKTGKIIPIEIKNSLIKFKQKNAVISIITDITVRKHHQKLQNTLIKIANLVNTTRDLSDLFSQIRKILSTIIDTTNFFISLYHEEQQMFSIVYEKDEKDSFDTYPMGKTLTACVIRRRKPLFVKEKEMIRMREEGIIKDVGHPAKVWLGVPLCIEDKIIGVVVVQSYTDENLYSEKDKEILEYVSGRIALAINRKQAEKQLKELNKELEQKVKIRTAKLKKSNEALKKNYEKLQKTQKQLVQSEKMAALGNLVAGVAHEINTPVGIAVTAASHLKDKDKEINKVYQNNTMKRSDFESFLKIADESTDMILTNLKQAAEQISSFKNVAVDQTSDNKRYFKVKNYIDEILLSLRPKIKKRKIDIQVNCDRNLSLFSYPGAFSQIITNLVMNSLIHGFDEDDKGQINIDVSKMKNEIKIIYSDDGKGIDSKNRKKIFEPFFTTSRNKGSSGLGLYLVYNIVISKLHGKIKLDTKSPLTTFKIKIPTGEEANEK